MINEKQGSNQLKVITIHLVINVFVLLLHGYCASPTFFNSFPLNSFHPHGTWFPKKNAKPTINLGERMFRFHFKLNKNE